MADTQKSYSEGQGSNSTLQRNRPPLPNPTPDYPRIYPVRSLLTDVQPDPQGPSPTTVRATSASSNVSTTVEGFHHLSNVLEADRDVQQQRARSRTNAAALGQYWENAVPSMMTAGPGLANMAVASTSEPEILRQVSSKPDMQVTEVWIAQVDENTVDSIFDPRDNLFLPLFPILRSPRPLP